MSLFPNIPLTNNKYDVNCSILKIFQTIDNLIRFLIMHKFLFLIKPPQGTDFPSVYKAHGIGILRLAAAALIQTLFDSPSGSCPFGSIINFVSY